MVDAYFMSEIVVYFRPAELFILIFEKCKRSLLESFMQHNILFYLTRM